MTSPRPRIFKDVFLPFLKLGSVGFGGPIAMLGYVEAEFVGRRNWVTAEKFQQIVAASKLFPGPLASLVSVRVGYARAGAWGGIAAGLGQILPAFFMILILAQTVQQLDHFPWIAQAWVGLSLAAIAVSFQATFKLTRPLFHGHSPFGPRTLTALVLVNAALTFWHPKLEAVFIISFGLLALVRDRWLASRRVLELGTLFLVFLTCFRASLFTFGSGIAIVPVLRTFFIDEHHWVSSADFLRGLTLGQITPGPLTIIAAYLGDLTFGFGGAVAATVGIFLPTFVFGIVVLPRFESLILNSPKFRAFFDGLLPAVCGAIFGALVRLLLLSVGIEWRMQAARIALAAILTFVAIWRNAGPAKIFAAGGLATLLLQRWMS